MDLAETELVVRNLRDELRRFLRDNSRRKEFAFWEAKHFFDRFSRVIRRLWKTGDRYDDVVDRSRALEWYYDTEPRRELEALLGDLNLCHRIVRAEIERAQIAKARRMIRTNSVKIKKPSKNTQAELNKIVFALVSHFKDLIENKDLWKNLWVDGVHLDEGYAQRLFYALAVSVCKDNDLDVSPESNEGGGPVDFKFSRGSKAKHLLEVKMSDGNLIHGYETQLEVYKKAASTESATYLVVEVHNLSKTKRNKLIGLYEKQSKPKRSNLCFVDARIKKSASKR